MASGIKFLYQFALGEYNVANPGVNVISVTSTASGDHSKTNLTTSALRETWRSTSVATQEIVIQANDTTNPIDVFAILNHNLSDEAVVTLKANTVNNFSSPPFNRTLIWNEKHIVLSETVTAAYPYWKITIIDPANTCGFIEIGRIVAGTSFTLTSNEDITDNFTIGTDDLAYKMKTEGYFRASNERVKVDKLQIRFDGLNTVSGSDTNYLGLKTMTNFVGETLPFLTILDPSDPYFQVVWGQLDQMPSRSFRVNRYTNMDLSIQEVF